MSQLISEMGMSTPVPTTVRFKHNPKESKTLLLLDEIQLHPE